MSSSGRHVRVAHDSADVDRLIGEYIDSFIEEENERNELVAHTLDAIAEGGMMMKTSPEGEGTRSLSPQGLQSPEFSTMSPQRRSHSRLQNAGDGLSVFRSIRDGTDHRGAWKLAYKGGHHQNISATDMYLLELRDVVFNLEKQFDKLELESANAKMSQDAVIAQMESKLTQTQKILSLRSERTKSLESERTDYKMRFNEASRQLKNIHLQTKVLVPTTAGGLTKNPSMRRAPSMMKKAVM